MISKDHRSKLNKTGALQPYFKCKLRLLYILEQYQRKIDKLFNHLIPLRVIRNKCRIKLNSI